MANRRDWSNLGQQVRDRREELGLTQEDVAQKGGPSTATQREIERGKPMRKRPAIYRKLETVLRLREGSAMQALLGGRIEPVEDDKPAARKRPRYADPALQWIWETPGVPEDVRRALVNMAVAMRSNENEA